MRQPRQLEKGATYHVTGKINRDESIFDEEEFKSIFLEVVKRAKKKYDFEITNFCVMHNHIHFMIKPLGESSLSRIMQWILSVFAVIYNKAKGYSGHVWKGRFFSKILDSLAYFVNTFRYICNNPVAFGFVTNACDYKYGGLYHLKKKIYDIIKKSRNK